jgi:hypothetical protein
MASEPMTQEAITESENRLTDQQWADLMIADIGSALATFARLRSQKHPMGATEYRPMADALRAAAARTERRFYSPPIAPQHAKNA